jgi:hypothetical protein
MIVLVRKVWLRHASVAVRVERRRVYLCTVTTSSGQLLGSWQDTWGILCEWWSHLPSVLATLEGSAERSYIHHRLAKTKVFPVCLHYGSAATLSSRRIKWCAKLRCHAGVENSLSLSLSLSAAATNRQLTCALASRPQRVLRGSHGIRDQVPGD